MRFHLRSIGTSPDRRPTMPEQDVGWIAANRRPFSNFAVGSLVPVVFEGYARVLHPAWASPGVPVRWETVATWAGRRIHSLAQWDFLFRPKGEPSGPAPFIAHPDTNGLPPRQLAALCELLATHTSTPELCFVGVWEGYGWHDAWSASPLLRLDQRTFLVRQGPLGLALAVGRGGPFGGISIEPPSIFWPADRTWLVASDPDLDSTYLGGSNALIEAVLTHPDLEAWRATADDEIAIGSDDINAG
jgi:hypothetical protein